MFLLNFGDDIGYTLIEINLQYKMFLLNMIYFLVFCFFIFHLQYKMFLLNALGPSLVQVANSIFTIQNVPIKLIQDKVEAVNEK